MAQGAWKQLSSNPTKERCRAQKDTGSDCEHLHRLVWEEPGRVTQPLLRDCNVTLPKGTDDPRLQATGLSRLQAIWGAIHSPASSY